MIDEQSTTQGWPLPHPENMLADDVLRLRKALQLADEAVAALQEALAKKADQGAVQGALDNAGKALSELTERTEALENGRVKSVNGVSGLDIKLLPEQLKLGPANGASAVSIGYDQDGRVNSVNQTVLGYPAATTIAYNPDGSVAQTQTLYRGLLRSESFSYDPDGKVTGVTASEVPQA